MAASYLETIYQPRRRSMDPPHRDSRHTMLLVPLWLLSGMAIYTELEAPNSIRVALPHRHFPPTCPDHVIPLGNANG